MEFTEYFRSLLSVSSCIGVGWPLCLAFGREERSVTEERSISGWLVISSQSESLVVSTSNLESVYYIRMDQSQDKDCPILYYQNKDDSPSF